jgi:hypothetical protein
MSHLSFAPGEFVCLCYAPIAEGIAQSLQAVRDGRAVMLTDTLKSVTGKKPIALKAWVEQRAALFEWV